MPKSAKLGRGIQVLPSMVCPGAYFVFHLSLVTFFLISFCVNYLKLHYIPIHNYYLFFEFMRWCGGFVTARSPMPKSPDELDLISGSSSPEQSIDSD